MKNRLFGVATQQGNQSISEGSSQGILVLHAHDEADLIYTCFDF